jgi:hypothetical protein
MGHVSSLDLFIDETWELVQCPVDRERTLCEPLQTRGIIFLAQDRLTLVCSFHATLGIVGALSFGRRWWLYIIMKDEGASRIKRHCGL